MLMMKAFHVIAMVAWFAGLFYLPRLFVYHVEAYDQTSLQRFQRMERRLYYGIMWPAALLTTVFGVLIITYQPEYYLRAGWMHAKGFLVLLLWIYHLMCGHYCRQFARGVHKRGSLFYRLFNEIPTLLLVSIVLLVVLKPL
jgi:putative membrane protein